MNDQVYFNGICKPSTDFGSVRNQLQSRPAYVDIDLSTARSLSAGTQLVLPIAGNFFYVDQRPNSGVAYVHFEDVAPGSTPIGIYPGAAFAVPFTQISIENVSQPGLSIRIIYGTDVSFIPSNAAGVSVLNSISVVDGGKNRTLANQAFFGYSYKAPVVGQYSMVQLLNPTASNKRTFVEAFITTGTVNGGIFVSRYGTPLTTAAGNGKNKHYGQADSVAQVRTDSGAALLGTQFFGIDVLALSPFQYKFAEPLALDAGEGIVVAWTVLNAGNNTNFEFYEE